MPNFTLILQSSTSHLHSSSRSVVNSNHYYPPKCKAEFPFARVGLDSCQISLCLERSLATWRRGSFGLDSAQPLSSYACTRTYNRRRFFFFGSVQRSHPSQLPAMISFKPITGALGANVSYFIEQALLRFHLIPGVAHYSNVGR
ncbi:hypothetical protein AFLA_008114 [Aspergillus flavus NRRL3357]|nr:hypothetical protein AFLA_008114 [Aspergillus flavus NRRL3357]